uniref:Uncharacterized protein n=1 Tax=Heterorhabditis bacteriophora TaxID=37862 RepID=A0A1I7XIP6_HETBA
MIKVSDSSSTGKRKDESGPTLHNLIVNSQRLRNPCVSKTRVIPDDQTVISQTLLELCESAGPFYIFFTFIPYYFSIPCSTIIFIILQMSS